MKVLEGLAVSVDLGSDTGMYVVDPKHYDQLKNALDHGEKGWIELDSIHGDGKAFLNLATITNLFLATASFCVERGAWEAACKLADGD